MNKKYLALGTFVVVTLGLLLWLAQNVGAIGSKKGDTYTVRLEHAAGIVEDNAVKIAGVKVGVVEEVNVDHDIAVLTLRMEKEIELHTDAIALVRAKSLLGEKYLQLDPGSVEAPVLEPGSEIDQVKETFEIDEVLNALQPLLGGDSSIAQSVAPLMERVDGLLAKAEGADGQPPIIEREQLTQSLEDVTETIATLRRFVENNEEPLTELVDNANKVLSNPKIPRIIANLDRVTSDSADRVPELLDKADSALTNVEKLTKELKPEDIEKLGPIIDDVAVASANLKDISKDFKDMDADLGPILKNLNILLKRGAKLDELTIRKFIQDEGIRVNLGTPKKTKQKIEELEQ